jgi:desulfoferrodoxin (superoxide reductase-like protein)
MARCLNPIVAEVILQGQNGAGKMAFPETISKGKDEGREKHLPTIALDQGHREAGDMI